MNFPEEILPNKSNKITRENIKDEQSKNLALFLLLCYYYSGCRRCFFFYL